MARRLLAPIRLSLRTDATTNPATQRASISEYAEEHGDTIIWTDVEDLDVSGAVPIRERPGLGPWLASDKINQWDAICAHEADRLSRDMLDYLQFARDMAKLGKVIIDVSDGTDTSTERGRQALEDRILGAQRERERIATRRRRAAKRLSDEGRWGGGRIPYGYSPRCICHDERRCPEPQHTTGWHLVQDPETAPVVIWMIDQAINGLSLMRIAAELNAQGTPSPLGRAWRDNSVRRILASPALLGHVVQMKGSVITTRRGNDGKPVKFTDMPLINEERWNLLQDSMRRRAKTRGMPQSRHMLYRVLFCRNCSPPLGVISEGHTPGELPREGDVQMYGHRRNVHTRKGSYYSCRRCGLSIRLDRAEGLIEDQVLQKAGKRVLLERRIIPGDDHAVEISRLERKAESRRNLLAEDPDDEDMARSLAATEAQIAEMRNQPYEPDDYEWKEVESGVTVAEHWESLDTAGKAKFLRDWEIVCYADRDGADLRYGWLDMYGETFKTE